MVSPSAARSSITSSPPPARLQAGASGTVNPCSTPSGPFTYHSVSPSRRYSTRLPLASGAAPETGERSSAHPHRDGVTVQLQPAPPSTSGATRASSTSKSARRPCDGFSARSTLSDRSIAYSSEAPRCTACTYAARSDARAIASAWPAPAAALPARASSRSPLAARSPEKSSEPHAAATTPNSGNSPTLVHHRDLIRAPPRAFRLAPRAAALRG